MRKSEVVLRRFSCFHPVFLLVGLVLLVLTLWPELDIRSSGFFAEDVEGFFLRENVFLIGLGKIAFYGARVLAVLLGVGGFYFFLKGQKESSKRLVFLFLCLLVGPGLFANVVFKDHWGRARPRDIVAFGGQKEFTPAFVISDSCKRNCSFVSGDAAFGFFLMSFAYVTPVRRRRAVFWGTLTAACFFGGARLLLGAHFLSDILAAAALVTATSAGLHALFFGRVQTTSFWRECLGSKPRAEAE